MWDAIKDVVFGIIEQFYNILGGATNSGDWGMAIIIVTLLFRLAMTPLMHKQAKSSFLMQKVQPKITSLQEKFKNDPTRLQQEMQKVYAEAKFNPLAGCLPMFLQMPLFIILFQVLNEMSERDGVATASFYNLVPDLFLSPSSAFAISITAFIPYLILMIIFAGATFLPMILQQNNQNAAQKTQMMVMAAVMSVFMLFISWNSPAGVLLFWGVSSLIGILQQQISRRIVAKKYEEDQAVKEPEIINIDVTRKAKKAKPNKKSKK